MNQPERITRSNRTWSLRREWSRAFALLLVLLLTAALATVVGVRAAVQEVQASARELHRESVTVTALRDAVVAHEQVALQLMSHDAVDRVEFVRQQGDIAARFDGAAATFAGHPDMQAAVRAARRSWQASLALYGLWSGDVYTMHGDHTADSRFFSAASDRTRAQLDDLEAPVLQAMDRGLDHGTTLERGLVAGLVVTFALALAVTVYFRRRMTRDLMRPVARLHQGVMNLKAGLYTHPIEVFRHDELGELAEAFNDMASALDQHHRALTLRATHDSLTGLANRATLTERLAASFTVGSERRALRESLLFIDIDDFKNVNDSLGHQGGDALLVQLAERLQGCVRPGDLVARLGGDEFAVIVLEDGGGLIAAQVAERILMSLTTPFEIGGTRLRVAVSIGVAPRSARTGDAAELLRQADFAMYMAKGAGKNQYKLFDAQMHEGMIENSALRADLAVASASGQLRLEYQPVVDLETGRIVGVEALVRWLHPRLGLLGPGDFIPLAEETGDIDEIGRWVLTTATAEAAVWRRDVPDCADLWLSVNLSPLQLVSPSSVAVLEAILADPATRSDRLVLEVTETALATEVDGAITALSRLRGLGARIAIDDFGTGFSSLSTLARLPVDLLKLDGSFVSGPGVQPTSSPILEGILGLAERLSVALVAEGIETTEQLDLLRALGYRLGQGYLLSRPAPVQDVPSLLTGPPLLRGHLARAVTHSS